MSVQKENKCSKCGVFGSLSPANLSRKTGERLYRSWCVSCEKARKATWVQDNIEHVLLKTRHYQEQHPEQVKQTKRRWAEANKEYHTEYGRMARKTRPDYYRAMVSSRRKRVQQNTPSWANKSDIRLFYQNCPKGFHVDHIVPLHGKTVSGLHVRENLQYLPASENMRKGNFYDGT